MTARLLADDVFLIDGVIVQGVGVNSADDAVLLLRWVVAFVVDMPFSRFGAEAADAVEDKRLLGWSVSPSRLLISSNKLYSSLDLLCSRAWRTLNWSFGCNNRDAHVCIFIITARSAAMPHVKRAEVLHIQTIF